MPDQSHPHQDHQTTRQPLIPDKGPFPRSTDEVTCFKVFYFYPIQNESKFIKVWRKRSLCKSLFKA